jgi:hypothetical protein
MHWVTVAVSRPFELNPKPRCYRGALKLRHFSGRNSLKARAPCLGGYLHQANGEVRYTLNTSRSNGCFRGIMGVCK